VLRVGKITAAKDVHHPTGTHLYELTVECGEDVDESKIVDVDDSKIAQEKKQSYSGTRTMLAPLRAHYTKDQLIGLLYVCVFLFLSYLNLFKLRCQVRHLWCC
jgi:tRNA-binding EMAP/Myf-like protein